MAWIERLTRRARMLLRHEAAERSMHEELNDHITLEIADRVRSGMDEPEARRTTLRDFGNVESIKEASRDARGIRPLEDAVTDVRFAARLLIRNPAFTLAAAGTFALGVGALTAIFSLVYGILLRPLPYARPERLVAAWEQNLARDQKQVVVSLDNYEAWRRNARGFSALAAVVPTSLTLGTPGSPERIVGAEVTASYFGVLGVPPSLGRDFNRDDEKTGDAIILSDALWKRRFDADPAILGRRIRMGTQAFTVVGVMPPHFEPPRWGWLGEQNLWVPLVGNAQKRSWGRFLLVLGRLGEGVSLEQARAEMRIVGAQGVARAAWEDGWSASLVPFGEQITGPVKAPLLVWLAAVALVLFIAVANVSTLTLAMMRRRRQELALRRALGATDRRLFRQLFAQSALVGLLGAAAGVAVAVPAVRVLISLLPADTPRGGSISVDGPVLGASLGVALIAIIVFGTLSAFRGKDGDTASPLSRDAGTGRTTRGRASGSLLSLQIAVAIALGVMAALMARSYAGLRGVDLGFNPSGIVLARVALPREVYGSSLSQRMFFAGLLEKVGALQGVSASGLISARPFGGVGPSTNVHDAALGPGSAVRGAATDVRFASSGLLHAMGMVLERGAWLEDGADDQRIPQVVIDATLSRALWPNSEPVGRELAIALNGGIVARVVGVVRDVRLTDSRTPPRPLTLLAVDRFPSQVADLVVRFEGALPDLLPSLHAVVAAKDPSLPLYSVTTMPALVNEATKTDRLTATLLAGFAAIALALSAVGVFGLCSGDVQQRRKEIGIRLALGAQESRVVVMMLGEVLRRMAMGVVAGLFLAGLLGTSMQSLLFGVRALDPLSIGSVTGAVVALTLLVTFIPAWQATKAQPLAALREE